MLCLKCRNDISDKAEFCPICKYKVQRDTKVENKIDRYNFRREFLSEFIYLLNCERSFLKDIPWYTWSVHCVGFAYNKSRSSEILNKLQKEQIIKCERSDVLGCLSDWENYAEGIFLTTNTIYVNTPKNKVERFKVNYYNIKKLEYDDSDDEPVLNIFTHSDKKYSITTPVFNKLNIKIFLQAALGLNGFSEREFERIKDIKMEILGRKSVGAIVSGTIHGNASAANNMFGMSRFTIPETGHGFAAERMNHLYDILHGKDAKIIGDDNAKNGADRLVDGVYIQSKYCRTGEACVDSCFDKNNGQFRYINNDGTVMQIEVPSDKYDEAVKRMAQKIREGKVPGHTNPEDAKDIVKKGNFTYEQAKRVAQAGTIESLTFDAINGAIICASAFGVTAVLTFACAYWRGDDFESALEEAIISGLKVGGIAFLTTVLGAQIARTGAMSVAQQLSSNLVELLGVDMATKLVNALRTNGSNIYGAAATKHLTKVLKNNIVTAVVSVIVLSAGDVSDIFRGRISGGQLVKNVTSTTASVAGGYAGITPGAYAGGKTGALIGGIFGPAGAAVGGTIGGLAGGLLGIMVGGNVAQSTANGIMDVIIDDDNKEIFKCIEERLIYLADIYMLNGYEVENVCDNFGADITKSTIKDIYAAKNRNLHIDNLLEKYIQFELKYRSKIYISNKAMGQSFIKVLKTMEVNPLDA